MTAPEPREVGALELFRQGARLESKIDRLDEKLDGHGQMLAAHTVRLAAHDERLTSLEEGERTTQITEHEMRITALEDDDQHRKVSRGAFASGVVVAVISGLFALVAVILQVATGH